MLKFEAGIAGSICKGLHAAMVTAAVTVKNHTGDAGGLGAFAKGCAETLGSLDVGLEILSTQVLAQRGKGLAGYAGVVVDRLRVDVLVGDSDAQTRTLRCAGNLPADAPNALLA